MRTGPGAFPRSGAGRGGSLTHRAQVSGASGVPATIRRLCHHSARAAPHPGPRGRRGLRRVAARSRGCAARLGPAGSAGAPVPQTAEPQVVPGPALFSSPFPFSRLPPAPGVGGTSPASSSLSNRQGGKERPALSCPPANFSGTAGTRRPPAGPGAAPDVPSPRRPGVPGWRTRAPDPDPAARSVCPSCRPLLRGQSRRDSPRRPAAAPDFPLCCMQTRAPRRRRAD